MENSQSAKNDKNKLIYFILKFYFSYSIVVICYGYGHSFNRTAIKSYGGTLVWQIAF